MEKKKYEVDFSNFSKIGMIDPKDIGSNHKAHGMIQLMKENLIRFKGFGFSLDKNEESFWLRSMYLWNVEQQYDAPIKFIAPVGSGKSTALEAFHIFMGRYSNGDKEIGFSGNNWGTIVVKPQIEDCEKFVKRVNQESGRQIAYAVFGSDQYIEMEITQDSEWEKQKNYPVLVITQSMLRSLVLKDKLIELTRWIDEEGITRRRTQLFVDERPVFKESFSLTASKIERLNELVHGLANSGNMEKHFYNDFEEETRRLTSELRRPNQARIRKLPRAFFKYQVPQQLHDLWDRNARRFSLEEFQLLEQFVNIVNNGGIIQVNENGASVTGGWNIWKRANFMNVIVLDGTGKNDPNYPKKLEDDKGELTVEFLDFDMEPDAEVYTNLLINVNRKHNIGSNWLNQDTEMRIQKVAELIKRIRKENHSLLVIGSKRMTDLLNREFDWDQSLSIVNWAQARGKNDFRHHDAVLILGNIIRSGADYVINVELDNPGVDIDPESNTSGGFHMVDPLAHEFSIADRGIHLTQIIGRIRPYKSNELKTVYMFSMEPKVVDFVSDHFKGCTLNEWELPFSLTSEVTRKTATDRFIDWLKEFAESDIDQIKAKEVYEDILGITRMQYGRIKKEQVVVDSMKALAIEFKGQSIKKISKV